MTPARSLQFASAIAALNSDSKLAKGYEAGVHKNKYWEDMDLIAKLPVVTATIYNNLYREGPVPCPPDPAKDWSQNFAEMIGYKDPMFTELMRLLPDARPGPHGAQEAGDGQQPGVKRGPPTAEGGGRPGGQCGGAGRHVGEAQRGAAGRAAEVL